MGVKPCGVTDCPNSVGDRSKLGLCHTHYMRQYKTGSVHADRPIFKKIMKVVDGKKPCRDCGLIKALEDFHRTPTNKGLGGRLSHCASCASIRKKHRKPSSATKNRKQAEYHRRRAVKIGAMSENVTIEGLIARDGTKCCYCEVELIFDKMETYTPRKASIEHVVPMIRGGQHTWGNVKLACLSCNLSKNSRLVEEWRATWE